jgi:hypothetical protein
MTRIEPRMLRRLEPAHASAKPVLAVELRLERGLLGGRGHDRKPRDARPLGGKERAGQKRQAGDPHG